MRRFLILFLCLVFLISVFVVPAFAITADEQADTLKSGWGGTSAPYGYTTSWFWRVVSELDSIDSVASSLKSGWSSTSAPSGYTSSWFWRVVSELDDISDDIYQIRVDINTIDSRVLSIQSNVSGLLTTLQNVSSNIVTMSGYLLNVKTDVASIDAELSLIGDDVDHILPEVISIDSTTTTISSNLSDVKSKVTDIELNTDYLETIDSDTSNLADLSTSLQNGSWLTSSSGGNWFRNLFSVMNNVYSNTKKLADIFATTDDLALKDSQANEEKAILSGLAQVDRVGTINDFTGLEGDMKEFFAMDDVDIGLMFGQVESGYSNWFSGYTARCLSVGGGASAVSGAAVATYRLDPALHEEPETPYLDAYDAEVSSILAGGHP